MRLSRRQALRLSAGTVAGLTIWGASPATAALAGPATWAGTSPEIPVVPGMLGDPRENELWYQYDEQLYYSAPQQLLDAYQAVAGVFGGVEEEVAFFWLAERAKSTYPRDYIAAWRPLRDALALISRSQLSIMDSYYGGNPAGLVSAFVDFGQGVLYDPRRPVEYRNHIMNGNPPPGYHVWHAYIMAMTFLGVDAVRWTLIDPLVGLAWHLQSIAKPAQDIVNPPQDPALILQLKQLWLVRTPAQIEEAFESVPYPAGVS
jgi:hypothetical protein